MKDMFLFYVIVKFSYDISNSLVTKVMLYSVFPMCVSLLVQEKLGHLS